MRTWISWKNEFIISIYRQAHFEQRSEKSIICVYVFQNHSFVYSTLCSYTADLPWSACSWQLWIHQMRNWTVNSTFRNKKPFSSLIPLSPVLWLCSSTGERLCEHQAARQILCSPSTDLPSLVAGSNLWAILALWDGNCFGDLFTGGYSNLTPSSCSTQVWDILPKDCPNHSLSSIPWSVPVHQCAAVCPLEHPGPTGFGWLF